MTQSAKRTGHRPRCMESFKLGASASLRLTITHLEDIVEGRQPRPTAHVAGKLRRRLYGLIEVAVAKPATRRRRGRPV